MTHFRNLFLTILSLSSILSSCAPMVQQIGRVNMISNRNVEPGLNYGPVSTYAGGSKKELKKIKSNIY